MNNEEPAVILIFCDPTLFWFFSRPFRHNHIRPFRHNHIHAINIVVRDDVLCPKASKLFFSVLQPFGEVLVVLQVGSVLRLHDKGQNEENGHKHDRRNRQQWRNPPWRTYRGCCSQKRTIQQDKSRKPYCQELNRFLHFVWLYLRIAHILIISPTSLDMVATYTRYSGLASRQHAAGPFF